MSLYTPKMVLLSQVAEVRDKAGIESQTHIDSLVSNNLVAAIGPTHQGSEDRALVLEIMTSLGILQPRAVMSLIPDLPSRILREVRVGLDSVDARKEIVPVGANLLLLASTLHSSPLWLDHHWTETAEVMAEGITSGHVLPVLRGLDVILGAIKD
jgi:hypothetical protein